MKKKIIKRLSKKIIVTWILSISFCLNIYANTSIIDTEIYNSPQINLETDFMKEGLLLPDLYNPQFEHLRAKVISEEQANTEDTSVALVRQSNGKIAYMVRDEKGDMQPFYPMALETGFWDTRLVNTTPGAITPFVETDWDYVFKDIRAIGANTVQVMINWSDWEPQNNQYDYTFLDNIVQTAAKHDLKTIFVIFFHSHTQPSISTLHDNFWAYHLDDRIEDGIEKNYAIQWGKDPYYSTSNFRKHGGRGTEIFLEYWHPQVFSELMEAISNLAEHYRDSNDVIAYQLGNEEGFNYYVNNGNDQNPYYQKMFDKWKAETGKTLEADFRLETINRVWQHMNNAIHSIDPYKPTTSNLQSGLPEASGKFDWNEGVDINFYKNLDMAGPMFYSNAHTIYPNMDLHYNFTTELPILFPTEIGSNVGLHSVAEKVYIAQTLERGGQGYGLYCYGELYQDSDYYGTPKPSKEHTSRMFEMTKSVEDIIWRGLPVDATTTQNMFMTQSVDQWATLSVLEKDEEAALGIMYFMGPLKDNAALADKTRDVTVSFKQAGSYKIEVMISDGVTLQPTIANVLDNGQYSVNVPMTNHEVALIKVTKQ